MVNIVFHAHHAEVTDALRERAEQALGKLASRLRGATDASVRFVDDGAARRVEMVMRVARRKSLVAEGRGPRFEGALADATQRLGAHVAHLRAQRARRRVAPVSITQRTAPLVGDDTAGVETRDEAPPRPARVRGA